MFVQKVAQALSDSAVGQFVAASSWAFPTLESIHVIAIVTVIGTVMVMDLRLVGVASRESAVTRLANDTLPWTWGAFVVAFMTGSLLFIGKAIDYTVNPFFFWKMVMIAIAGLNMAIFHFFTWKSVDKWDSDSEVPLAGKIAGGLSLFFWIVVVFLGRAIGFTLDKFSQS